MIATRNARRWFNVAGAAAVVGLMSYALYAQHILGLDACPLCILQRVAIISLGAIFAVAALHAPAGIGARVYAALGAIAALTGMGISGWHVRVQNLPPAEIPSCGKGFDAYLNDYLDDYAGLRETLALIFTGSGECHEVNWSFLGLSMPTWVFLWFAALGALIVRANWSPLRS